MKKKNLLKLFLSISTSLSIGQVSAQTFNIPDNIIDVGTTRCVSDMKPTVFKADTSWTYPRAFSNTFNGNYFNAFSIPLVADLTNDGKPEIICLGISDNYNLGFYPGNANKIVIMNGDGTVKKTIGNTGTATSASDFPVFATISDGWHGSPSNMAIAKIKGQTYPCIILTTGGTSAQAGQIYCYQITDANCNYTVKWTKTGTSRFTYNYPTSSTLAAGYYSAPNPIIADFNGDGNPELLVYNKIFDLASGNLVATTEPDMTKANMGRRTWFSDTANDYESNQSIMTVADFNNDGLVEIVAGNKIYRPQLSNPAGGEGTTFLGGCDITKYDFRGLITGTLPNSSNNDNYGDGFSGVADINGDGKLEVVAIGRQLGSNSGYAYYRIFAWTPDVDGSGNFLSTGTLVAAQSLYNRINTGVFGPLFIGDINGKLVNGLKLPEICFCAGYSNETVANLTPKIFPTYDITPANLRSGTGDQGNIWGLTYDPSEAGGKENALKVTWAMKHADASLSTGLTVFDFNNSGTAKIVYQDEYTLRVIDGAVKDFVPLNETPATPGTSVLMSNSVLSYTAYEYPVIADINGDNAADFICYGSYAHDDCAGRLFVFEGKGAGFAGAPPKWNQFSYFPTLVNKDMSIPMRPAPLLKHYDVCDINGQNCVSATPYNGTLLQQPLVKSTNYYPAILTPDLVISDLKIMAGQTPTSTAISFKVKNKPDAGSAISVLAPITIYKGASIASGVKVDTLDYTKSTPSITGSIYPGSEVTVTYTMPSTRSAFGRTIGDLRGEKLWVRLTDDGTAFPATGYYECMVSDNDATVSSIFAMNDAITINRGEYKVLDVLANDLKPCSNEDVEIIIESQTNSNLLKIALNGSKNTLLGMAGATTGSSVISYRIACGTDTSNVATATVTISGPEPPVATATWTGAINSDWNNTANWTPAGRPNYNSNVVIPAYSGLTGVKTYPDLNYFDLATCNTIYFGNGAEVAKPVHLTYNKAKVQLKLMSNRWNMVAPPLKDMYTGDYIFGNGQLRQLPAKVYQKEYQSANISSGTAISAGNWSTPNKALNSKFPFGSALAVWLDYADEPTTATSKMMSDAEAFVFPSDSTAFCSYGMNPSNPLDYKKVIGTYATPRTAYSPRFVYDKLPAELTPTDTIITMPVANDASFQTVIIPNPMMSHIDYVKLQADNADKLGASLKIVNSTPAGDAYEVYQVSGDQLIGTQGGAMPSGFKIPPMQSFIADKFTQSATFTNLTFNPSVSVTAPTVSLRSSTDPEAGMNLFRVQLNSEGGIRNSGILIIKAEGASNKFVRNEDAFTTFPDNSTAAAIIYAITDNGSPTGIATSINQIGDLSEPVELGVRCKNAGTYSIVFSDLAKFAKAATEIWLEDKVARDKNGNSVFQNVTTTPNYAFTTSDKVVEGRFFIHFKKAATGIPDVQPEASNIRIYASKNVVTVATPTDDQIQSVQVVNVQGQTIISKNGVNTDYITLTLPEAGNVYVVKVTTPKAQKSQKVVIK